MFLQSRGMSQILRILIAEDTVKQQKAHLDILFANAGTGRFAPLGTITEEHFDKTFNANVKGLLFTVQKALPLFQRWRLHYSECVDRFEYRSACNDVYSASKAAVRPLRIA